MPLESVGTLEPTVVTSPSDVMSPRGYMTIKTERTRPIRNTPLSAPHGFKGASFASQVENSPTLLYHLLPISDCTAVIADCN